MAMCARSYMSSQCDWFTLVTNTRMHIISHLTRVFAIVLVFADVVQRQFSAFGPG